MFNKKLGFTLVEILITVAIIAIIAILAVPTLFTSTKETEYKATLKKSVSMLNQAISLSIALGTKGTASAKPTSEELANFFKKRLNISADGPEPYETTSFYTTDGIFYRFVNNNLKECANNASTTDHSLANCVVIVDVNGDKLPNEMSTGSGLTSVFKDQYYLVIRDRSVIPAGNSIYSVAQEAIFE